MVAPTSPSLAPAVTRLKLMPPPVSEDLLAPFADLVASIAVRADQAQQRTVHELDLRENFLTGFATACEHEVLPALAMVAQRLEDAGGGGLIEQHLGNEPRFRWPTVTFWMSFAGEVAAGGRPDMNAYIELQADPEKLLVEVSEGDMWQGHGGGRSGRTGYWPISDLTGDRLVRELLTIGHRAVA